MICFPTAKINLGLQVLEKRPDNFHNIATVLVPILWFDVLEFQVSERNQLVVHGKTVNLLPRGNLISSAWRLLNQAFKIPPLNIHLFKSIPIGAGLAGASADAAFLITKINDYFELRMDITEMKSLAGKLGSDCPFFIENKSSLATGKGDILSPVQLMLENYFLYVVYPGIPLLTSNMYHMIEAKKPEHGIGEIITQPIGYWKNHLKNEFEVLAFRLHPSLALIKEKLYEQGAIYASMSGSGSAIYGIFEKEIFPSPFLSRFESQAGYLFRNKIF